MNEAFDRDRLLELAELHCRAELDDQQQAELAALLRNRPEACAVFGNFLQLHANLEERLLSEAAVPKAPPAPATVEQPVNVRRQISDTLRFLAHPTPSHVVAAIIVGLLITAMAVVAPPFYRAVWQGEHAKPRSVAKLTRVHDVVWAEPTAPLHLGQLLLTGQQLALSAGLAEITFDNGVRVIVEGKTSLHIIDEHSAHLDHGQAVTRVTRAGKGFAVTTPHLRVVDLGTEFGVVVQPNGASEIVVFDGVVDVFLIRDRNSAPRRLLAGNYLQFSGSGPLAAAVSAPPPAIEQTLTRVMPDATAVPVVAGLPEDATYEDIVTALRPVAWYRMNRADGTQLADDGPFANHGEIPSPRADAPDFWQPGVLGDSLELRGPQFGDYAIVSEYPQARNGQLTVMAWVYAESGPQWASIAKNWGDSRVGQFHFGLHADGSRLSIFVQAADGKQVAAIDPASFPLGQWQHVAFVVTGSKLRLYRDRNLVATTDCGPIAFPVAHTALGIGCKLRDAGDAPASAAAGYWHGRIDELVIVNAALGQAVIERCHTASLPPSTSP